jgi:hypothetical protein
MHLLGDNGSFRVRDSKFDPMQKKTPLLLLCAFGLIFSNACKNSNKSTATNYAPGMRSISAEDSETPEADPLIEEGIWVHYNSNDLPDLEKNVELTSFELWRCDYSRFKEALSSNPSNVQIPFDGKILVFELANSGTMALGLAAKYPNVQTYKGRSKDGKIQARVDLNKNGVYAEMYNAKSKLILSPYLKGNNTFYAQYPESSLPEASRDDSFK